MTTRRDPAFERQLLAGTTAFMLLATLEAEGRAMHAYEIGARMATSQDVAPKLSTLYPQLRGLEAKGLLASHLEASDQGPARRVYAITPAGRKVLASWRESWTSVVRRIERILERSDEPRKVRPTSDPSRTRLPASGRRGGDPRRA